MKNYEYKETEPAHQARVDWIEFGKQYVNGSVQNLYALTRGKSVETKEKYDNEKFTWQRLKRYF